MYPRPTMFSYKILALFLVWFFRVSISSEYKSFDMKEFSKYEIKGTFLANVRNESNMYTYHPLSSVKTGAVERSNQKDFETVNMSWRNSNFYLDPHRTATSKPSVRQNRTVNNVTLTTNLRYFNNLQKLFLLTSTLSYMDIYYLDENEVHVKSKDYSISPRRKVKKSKSKRKVKEKSLTKILKQPVLTIENSNMREFVTGNNFFTNLVKYPSYLQQSHTYYNQTETYNISHNSNISETVSHKIFSRNNTDKAQWLGIFFNDPLNKLGVQSSTKREMLLESTIDNDRIKFFEMYDTNTIATTKSTISNKTRDIKSDKVSDETKVENNKLLGVNGTEPVSETLKYLVNKKRNILNSSYKHEKISAKTRQGQGLSDKETTSVWSEYPYTSVFIYEPLSIYCDAAAVNNYWLIAAGSCLSRHSKNKILNGRSAYVAYCGDIWWHPEAIAYVRRTFIHPMYKQRNKTRRYLYNIGIIQVITSLKNNCNGWAPASLATHKFSSNEKGSLAVTLGWGLERYNKIYTYYDLPKEPLAVYEGRVFSKSCPGGPERKKESTESDLNSRNLYCLSLPYNGHKNTTHGSLLLVERKLTALSLKRRWQANEMSVQYTGIWRLVPWILELTHDTSQH